VPPQLRRRWLELVSRDGVGQMFLPRLAAIVITLMLAAIGIAWLWRHLLFAVTHMDLQPYEQGVQELVNMTLHVTDYLNITNNTTKVEDRLRKELTDGAQNLGNLAYTYGSTFLESSTSIIVQVTFFLLYSMFWLLQPMTAIKDVFKIVRTYFVLKTACNLVFGVLIYGLLHWARVELAIVIALFCFVLAYIPEVGAIIAVALPVPLILLDSRRAFKERGGTLVWSVLGMAAIKFVVANGLESVVMGNNKTLAGAVSKEKEFVETHPVIVLFAVVLCGEVWGPIGMIIAVPLISLVRYYIARELERTAHNELAAMWQEGLLPGAGAGVMSCMSEPPPL